jgi:uncharacterized protein (DUF934 family)
MATLIKERRIASDNWQLLDAESWLPAGDNGPLPVFQENADLLLPLRLWESRRAELLARRGRIGVLLEAWDEIAPLAKDLSHFALIAVRIAQLGDGRAYSLARLLRERHGYRGELRATGAVLRDNLDLLARCGFDSFLLREDQGVDAALAAFDDFSEAYQSTVMQPVPLFRRRLAATRA